MSRLSDDQLRRLRDVVELPDLGDARYRIEDRLGAGGMATVYRAFDSALDRQVALKILTLSDSAGDLAVRMLREAKVVAQLEHPGIVPIHDVGTLPDGRVYYTMKLVQGRTLDQFVSASPSMSDRLRIFLRICEAVAFAHSRGVLHCDLKPSNIMVGAFGEALVMDWGVAAKLREPEASSYQTDSTISESMTQHGMIVGTPGYLSPEQAEGANERVDARSDIYGLGGVLYFTLTGQPPIRESAVATALDRTQRGDIASPRSTNREIHRRLEAICMKALALRPEDRYATVNALSADIGLYLDGEPVSARRETVWEKAGRWLARNQFIVVIALVYLLARLFFLLWRGL